MASLVILGECQRRRPLTRRKRTQPFVLTSHAGKRRDFQRRDRKRFLEFNSGVEASIALAEKRGHLVV
jgi:hypothetical protein